MSRPARLARFTVIAVILGGALSATPANIVRTQFYLALFGLTCLAVIMLRRHTAGLDIALGWLALWAAASVMAGPFIPVIHLLRDATQSAR